MLGTKQRVGVCGYAHLHSALNIKFNKASGMKGVYVDGFKI